MKRAVALIVVLAAAPAGAQLGFIRTKVAGTDRCIFWGQPRTLTYQQDAAGYSRALNYQAPFNAEDAAYASWITVAQGCSDFSFKKGMPIADAGVGYDPNSPNNANVLIFREQNCADPNVVPPNDPCNNDGTCANQYRCWSHDDFTIALTTTTFSTDTGLIFDADTEFNAAPPQGGGPPSFIFTTVDSPTCDANNSPPNCVSTDLQNTLTHEIGHSIGLDHVLDDPNSTMAPTANIGDLGKRVIDPGTQTGFCFIYPNGRSTPPCDPTAAIDQRITAVNQGTAGINIGCSVGESISWAPWLVLALWVRRRRSPSA